MIEHCEPRMHLPLKRQPLNREDAIRTAKFCQMIDPSCEYLTVHGNQRSWVMIGHQQKFIGSF
jgi:hypothetical protein